MTKCNHSANADLRNSACLLEDEHLFQTKPPNVALDPAFSPEERMCVSNVA